MTPFLERLDEETRAELRALAVTRTWSAGSVLFREGDRADRVLVVEAGVVKAVTLGENGSETILGLRGPGAVLGELAAIDGGRRSASVIAIDPVTALAVPHERFLGFLRRRPSAAVALVSALAERLRDASRRQAEFGSLEATMRVAYTLAELGAAHGVTVDGGLEVRLLSQDELAGLCATSRDSAARALRRLRDAGLIETSRRAITIVDVDALRRWSAG